jgi:hypothetical protein
MWLKTGIRQQILMKVYHIEFLEIKATELTNRVRQTGRHDLQIMIYFYSVSHA